MNRSPDGRPFAFHDLPAKCFPLSITAFVGDEVVWEIKDVEPYCAVTIPGASKEHQGRIRVRVQFATGEEVWS